MQRRVDVDREAHGRWYGSGVPGFLGQVRALPANAFVRAPPDPTYADGDDSTWMSVDWPSLTRTEMVLGRRVNVIDTGGDGPPLLFLHGLGGLWQNWLLNIPAFMGSLPGHRAGPAGVRAARRCRRGGSRSRASRG